MSARDDSAPAAARTVRAFFAIELGDGARRSAAALIALLRERPGGGAVRWVRPEGIHVTLRFLGETDVLRIPPLVRGVAAQTATLAPFQLGLGAPQLFPSPRRPRVVALHVEPEAPLAALAGAVERGVVAAGFEPEPRGFRAHLTLGRVREGGFPALDGVPPPPHAPFEVREVVLFHSRLGPQGSTYTPLERLPLGPGASAGSSGPRAMHHP